MNRRLIGICCFILFGYLVIAIGAGLNWLGSEASVSHEKLSYALPSADFILGNDFLGRSILARAIQGTKIAFLIGSFSAALATLIGLMLGLIAGYFGGWIDEIVIWLYTTLESIPYILLLSAFAFVLGPGVINLFIALGLTGWVKLCRLTRAEVLKHRNQDYVIAAQAVGTSHSRRLFRHIMPNVLHLALIQFSLSFVFAIKAEVILSYLGLGVEPGTPSWGLMISDAANELLRGFWWNLITASVFMFFLVLAVNLLSDQLRIAFDPKQRG